MTRHEKWVATFLVFGLALDLWAFRWWGLLALPVWYGAYLVGRYWGKPSGPKTRCVTKGCSCH